MSNSVDNPFCKKCQQNPTKSVYFPYCYGMIIWFGIGSYGGTLCRECAEECRSKAVKETLCGMWFNPLSLVLGPPILLVNCLIPLPRKDTKRSEEVPQKPNDNQIEHDAKSSSQNPDLEPLDPEEAKEMIKARTERNSSDSEKPSQEDKTGREADDKTRKSEMLKGTSPTEIFEQFKEMGVSVQTKDKSFRIIVHPKCEFRDHLQFFIKDQGGKKIDEDEFYLEWKDLCETPHKVEANYRMIAILMDSVANYKKEIGY